MLVVTTAAAGLWWLDSVSDNLMIVDALGKKVDLDLAKPVYAEPYTVLILGYDIDEGGTSRSDTIMLARIDEREEKIWLLSIPRDVRVDIPGYGYQKINAAYAIGGPQLAVETVANLTGIEINHYVGIELEGFVGLVDALGGVEIDVPMYIEAGGGYREEPIEPGTQTLDGYQSLWFVRSRYQFADQDITRVANQQHFLKAVAEQASNIPATKLIGVVNAVSSMVQTDMGLVQLGKRATALRAVGGDNIYTATAPAVWVEPYLEVIEPDFTDLVNAFANGRPMGISPYGDDDLTDEDIDIIPADVSVDVRNGSTRNGIAMQASTLLQSAGFSVGEVGNVLNPGSYSQTLIVYKDSVEKGRLVASFLQPGVEVRASNGTYSFEGDVLIVVGSDWDLEKVPVSQSQ
jgi:LCP family protein required for cell wall assembly